MFKLSEKKIRLMVFAGLLVVTLALHLLPKPVNTNAFRCFYNSYLVDIILPCYLFLLLTVSIIPKIKQHERLAKALMAACIFFIGFTVETMQYFNIRIFGSTFDYLDYLMYFLGVMLGLIIDYCIIEMAKRIDIRI